MLRDLLRQSRDLRDFLAELSPLERKAYAIMFVIIPFILLGLINLAPIHGVVKLSAAIVVVVVTLGLLAIVYSGSRKQKDAESDERNNHPSDQTQAPPPKPDRLPTVGAIATYLDSQESDEDINRKLLTVLESIDRSNKLAEQRREQEERESRLRQQRLDELLNSKTVRYSEIPGFLYFVKRGLWKMVIAWIVFCLALVITLSLTGEVIEWAQLIFLALLLLACIWVSIRGVCDWRWTQRTVIGIRIGITQPRNAFLLLFGADYKLPIFDCRNVVVKKTKSERFLLARTATVSIDTPIKNTEDDNDDGDAFNAMENMRHPYVFRDMVMDLREELTMSQSNIIKRLGQ